MMRVRLSQERGFADHGWLQGHHSFSFADYYDPAHMGWGNLRVINEDWIAPGAGFGMHPHRDMEIVTYVLQGALTHQDSMGNLATIVPGEVQRMSAGSGVRHSELNQSLSTTHLLQIWIEPRQRGMAPGYEQTAFGSAQKRGRLCPVATPDGREGSVTIQADATLYAGLLDGAESAELVLNPARKAYVQVVSGPLRVNGQVLQTGDAVLLAEESLLRLDQGQQAEVLVFDLAA